MKVRKYLLKTISLALAVCLMVVFLCACESADVSGLTVKVLDGRNTYVIKNSDGQTIADDDPNYIYKTIIDKVQINFQESKTLTPNKRQTKQIRAVIETHFTTGGVNSINAKVEELYQSFKTNPEQLRREILNTYTFDIDWCALFIHYLLVNGLK